MQAPSVRLLSTDRVGGVACVATVPRDLVECRVTLAPGDRDVAVVGGSRGPGPGSVLPFRLRRQAVPATVRFLRRQDPTAYEVLAGRQVAAILQEVALLQARAP